jgi:hypothetical protein
MPVTESEINWVQAAFLQQAREQGLSLPHTAPESLEQLNLQVRR